MPIRFALALLLTAALLPAAASAQQDFSAVEITTVDLGDGLAMLQGAGGNIGVSAGADGVILIDDQFAPLTEKIRAAVGKLSDAPIRFVLNTHWHSDHTGGNENLGRAGALIAAHANVRVRMGSEQFMAAMGRRFPPSPPAALPVVTYEQGVVFHLNGHAIRAISVGPAHTDGDSIVHFERADLIHTGDTYFAEMYPFFDASSGGSIDGMIAAADAILELAGPATRIIPGHGPLSDRAGLAEAREMLATVRQRVSAAIAAGRDRDAVVAAGHTAEFDARFGAGQPAERFVGLVYDSLKGN